MPSYSSGNLKVGLAAAYVVLVLLSAVPVWFAKQLVDSERLARSGVLAEGQVIERLPAGRSRRQTTFFVTVRFLTGDGTPIETKIQVTAPYWNDLSEGASVRLRYMPNEPRTVEVDGMTGDKTTLYTSLLGMTAFVAALWLALLRYKPPSPLDVQRAMERAGYLARPSDRG